MNAIRYETALRYNFARCLTKSLSDLFLNSSIHKTNIKYEIENKHQTTLYSMKHSINPQFLSL